MKPRERPIPFSTPMILALLNGTKVQTRRIMSPQPVQNGLGYSAELGDIACRDDSVPPSGLLWKGEPEFNWEGLCPYGVPGELPKVAALAKFLGDLSGYDGDQIVRIVGTLKAFAGQAEVVAAELKALRDALSTRGRRDRCRTPSTTSACTTTSAERSLYFATPIAASSSSGGKNLSFGSCSPWSTRRSPRACQSSPCTPSSR
jgi:hypothetical protein